MHGILFVTAYKGKLATTCVPSFVVIVWINLFASKLNGYFYLCCMVNM